MPIEDALILISRNFEAYMKGEHLPPENSADLTLLDRHPTTMQVNKNIVCLRLDDRSYNFNGEISRRPYNHNRFS